MMRDNWSSGNAHCFHVLAYYLPLISDYYALSPKPFLFHMRLKSQGSFFHDVLRCSLKGHGNEADFLGFLQKLGPHRSLTLPFEPFRFWLRIRGDIRNRKTTPRLAESGSRRLSDSVSRGVADSTTRRVGESTTHRLAMSGSRLLNV